MWYNISWKPSTTLLQVYNNECDMTCYPQNSFSKNRIMFLQNENVPRERYMCLRVKVTGNFGLCWFKRLLLDLQIVIACSSLHKKYSSCCPILQFWTGWVAVKSRTHSLKSCLSSRLPLTLHSFAKVLILQLCILSPPWYVHIKLFFLLNWIVIELNKYFYHLILILR